MRIRLLTNIGTEDAGRLGLTAAKAKEGAVVQLDRETGDKLIERGWGEDADAADRARKAAEDEAEGGEVRAEAGAPRLKLADGEAPDLQGMTKEEIREYAEKHGIDGVTTSQTKDEMISAVESAITPKTQAAPAPAAPQPAVTPQPAVPPQAAPQPSPQGQPKPGGGQSGGGTQQPPTRR